MIAVVMKKQTLLFACFALVIVLFSSTCVLANVIGIDFGSDTLKVAVVSPGKALDIVTNFQSKRKTPMCVSFNKDDRSFGADAAALMTRRPESTFARIFRMIGHAPDHPHIKEFEAQHYPYKIYANESTGLTQLKVESTQYTPEELLAMMMDYIKKMTKNHVGKDIKDCVITVPSFFTQHEKRAVYTAAEIADLNILSLIEENTAAALHFGMDRVFDTPQTILFYNMGSGGVQVTVVTYKSILSKEGSKNKTVSVFDVVGKAWDSQLGAAAFDVALAQVLSDRFNKMWETKKSSSSSDTKDVRLHSRPITRIRNEASKLREILSANNEMPLRIEQLHADVDLHTKISRNEFETIGEALFNRLVHPIDAALQMANLTLADLQGVELLGGGVRMPKVKSTLEEYFRESKLELGQHLNGDEAMALGAAFRAANISTAFRVRHVGMTDISTIGVSVQLNELPTEQGGFINGVLNFLKSSESKAKDENKEIWSKQASLFPKKSAIPSKTKTLAFHYDKDVICKLEYERDEDEALLSDVNPIIAVFNITGIAAFAEEHASKGLGQPKVHISFALDGSGLVSITKAEATLELPVVNATASATGADESSTEASSGDATAGDKNAEASSDEEDAAGANASTSAESSSSSSKTSGDGKAESKQDKAKSKKTKQDKKSGPKDNIIRKTLVVTLNSDAVKPPAWSAKLVAEAKERLKRLNARDAEKFAREAALNDLETTVYNVRSRLRDDEKKLSVVSTEEQREAVISLCNEVEEWIYDEGSNESISAFRTKEMDIKSKGDAIFKRHSEHTARPAAVKKALKQLDDVTSVVNSWESTSPHISAEEKESLLATVSKVRSWIQESVQKQEQLTPFEAPAFASQEVHQQMKPLTVQFDKLLKKPKPAPEKNATTSSATSNSTAGNDTNNNGTKIETELPSEEEAAAANEDTIPAEANDGEAPSESLNEEL